MKAWAKINLTLDIIGKRPDGYHELASVMQAICLHDTLVIRKTERQGIKIKCDCPALPRDEGNLAYQAAQLLLSENNISTGIFIELYKKIPVAAGLAGGSSDCAAALLGLNSLLNLDLSQAQLLEMARKLGADVPFCLISNQEPSCATALAEGIGEQLTPLPCHPEVFIVLVRPPVSVSTKDIFSAWTKSARIADMKSPAVVQALVSGEISEISANLGNDLAPAAIAMHPEIAIVMTALQEQNAIAVNMSGSGPTVFAYFTSEEAANMAIKYIQNNFPGYDTYFTQPNTTKKLYS